MATGWYSGRGVGRHVSRSCPHRWTDCNGSCGELHKQAKNHSDKQMQEQIQTN